MGNIICEKGSCLEAQMLVNDIFDDKINPFSRAAVAKRNNRRKAKI